MNTSSPDVNFEFTGLLSYLDKKNIIGPTVGTILSYGVMDIITEIYTIVLVLMFGKKRNEKYTDAESMEEDKKKSIYKHNLVIRGKTVDIGKLIVAVIKFVIILYITIVLTSLFKKIKNNI